MSSALQDFDTVADPFFDPEACPYIGLRTFEAEDRRYFCGRDEHCAEIIERLHKHRFVAVVGLSGSGKSSLIKAGVVPELRADHLRGSSSDWLIATTTPETEPVRRMEERLILATQSYWQRKREDGEPELPTIEEVQKWSMTIRETIAGGTLGLAKAIASARLRERTNVLLVIDQFEELFRYWKRTSRDGKDEVEIFIQQLLEVSSDKVGKTYVVITMRSEYMGDCARYAGLAEAVNAGLYLTPRLNRIQLQQAITLPAVKCRGGVTDELVQRILNDLVNDQDQLPVLQHALMRSWEETLRRGSRIIGVSEYEKSGGSKALNDHAEQIYKLLGSAHSAAPSQRAAEAVFKRITKLANREGGILDKSYQADGTRDPATVAVICDQTGLSEIEVTSVADVFRERNCAFLRPGDDTTVLKSTSMIDITHESLIRKWERLGCWVQEEAKSASVFLQLASAAAEAPEGELLSEHRVNAVLDESQRWSAAWTTRYGGGYKKAIEYLQASEQAIGDKRLAEKLAEEKRIEAKLEQKQKRRIFVIAVALITVIFSAIVAGAVAWVLFPALSAHIREQKADEFAGRSTTQRNLLGAGTQERAALLEIASIREQPTPANTDVDVWESFDRITKGKEIPVLESWIDSQNIQQQYGLSIFSNLDESVDKYRVFVAPAFTSTEQSPFLSLRVTGSSALPDYRPYTQGRSFAAISSYGRRAATECKEGTASIVDLATGRSIRVSCKEDIRLIVDSAKSGNFVTAEGKRPESASVPAVSRLKAWQENGSLLHDFGSALIMKVLLSPDGEYIAIISSNREIGTRNAQKCNLRRLGSGAAVATIDDVSDYAPEAFSYDSRYFAVGGEHGQINIKALEGVRGSAAVSRATISSGSRRSLSGEQLGVTQTQVDAPVLEFPKSHESPITSLAFGNRTYLLASADIGKDNVVRVEDAGLRKTLWSDHFGRAASQLVFSRNDTFLGLALGEGTARVKYAGTGIETARVTHRPNSRVTSIAFSFDEQTALSSSAGDGLETLIFKTVHQPVPLITSVDACKYPQAGAISGDGTILIAACTDLGWGAPKNGQLSGYKPVSATIFQVSPDQNPTGQAVIRLGALDRAYPTSSGPPSCQFALSQDGRVGTSVCEGNIELFSVEGSAIHRLDRPNDWGTSPQPCKATSVALNKTGEVLAVGGACPDHSRLEIYRLDRKTWHLQRGESLVANDDIRRPDYSISTIALNDRATLLAAGSLYGRVWLKPIGEDRTLALSKDFDPMKLDAGVNILKFRPDKGDGEAALMVGAGVTSTLFRVRDGRILAELLNKGPVKAVTFSDSGNIAAIASDQGAINIVKLDRAHWYERLRAEILSRLTNADLVAVHRPTSTLTSTPGWVLPPSDSAGMITRAYMMRFVRDSELEIGADEPRVLEPRDFASMPALLSISMRNIQPFQTNDLESVCSSLREDLSNEGKPNYKDECAHANYTNSK